MARAMAILMLLPLAATASDQQRISFLEQEVRNLQRQVQALSRQLDELRMRPESPPGRIAAPQAVAPASGAARWLDAGRWRQLRRGMNELEVIQLLGPPTSMREEAGARVLLYALEIGAAGFLGGSVILRDRLVSEVQQPICSEWRNP